jgi:hypothetical protein
MDTLERGEEVRSSEKVNKIKILKKKMDRKCNDVKLFIIIKLLKYLVIVKSDRFLEF